jgi:hypothetical protein
MKTLRRLAVVFVVLTLIGWARCARAAVDVTGRWDSSSCAAGQCVFGDPAPAGTPCDDGDACTTGDRCTDFGFCSGAGTVTCATCEQCDRDAGCVARPRPSFSCDVTGSAILTLSVAKPPAPVVSWRRTDNRTDTSPEFRPVGDPRVDTEYTLCVFDAVGLVAGAAAAPAGPAMPGHAGAGPDSGSTITTARGRPTASSRSTCAQRTPFTAP